MADDNPTKFPEMIERVARAICVVEGDQPDEIMPAVSGPGWSAPAQPRWVNYYPQARAAITAMREPTDAMVDAGRDWYVEDPEGDARRIWHDMINAALKEPSTGHKG